MFSVFLVACKEKGVVSYDIPKESLPEALPMTESAAPSPAPSAPAAPAAPAAASGWALQWEVPAHWDVKVASGFRKGSYGVVGAEGKSADVSVITFPQQAGGLLPNLNRWRGQAGFDPAATVEDETVTMLESGSGVPVLFVQLQNKDASGDSILGGIVSLADATWFFKMTGPWSVLSGELDSFQSMLKSVSES